MNTSTQNDPTDSLPGGTTLMDKPRRLVCLDAAWEIDALARLLPTLVKCEGGGPAEFLQVRGISARLQFLSSLLLEACCDQSKTTEELSARLGHSVTNNQNGAQK